MDADRMTLEELHRGGASRDEVLSAMRQRGLTVAQAIKAARHLFNVGLGDAKTIVTSHPSWSELAEKAGPFHEALIQAMQAEAAVTRPS